MWAPEAAGPGDLRSACVITFVPAFPATIPGMSASEPMAARLPVLAANRAAASSSASLISRICWGSGEGTTRRQHQLRLAA
jgi:hypothetical protein